MGLIRSTCSLSNPTRPDLPPLEVTALADSGAVPLCIREPGGRPTAHRPDRG